MRRRLRARFGALATVGVVLSALVSGSIAPAANAALHSALTADVSKSAMRRAVVPSLCGHPAGRLTDGKLPGIPVGMGGVWLDSVAIGRVGGRRLAVASISCNQGGIGWPGNLVMYSSPDKVVGSFPLSGFTRGGRQTVSRVWISKGKIKARIQAIAAADDNDLWGTRSALASFAWNKSQHRVVLSRLKVYDERKAAARLVAAVRKGDARTARRYATSGVVAQLMSSPWRTKYQLGKCIGVDSPEWFPGPGDQGIRQCHVGYKVGALALRMGQRSWNTYQAVGIYGIAGA
jgi:hypothetical protein